MDKIGLYSFILNLQDYPKEVQEIVSDPDLKNDILNAYTTVQELQRTITFSTLELEKEH